MQPTIQSGSRGCVGCQKLNLHSSSSRLSCALEIPLPTNSLVQPRWPEIGVLSEQHGQSGIHGQFACAILQAASCASNSLVTLPDPRFQAASHHGHSRARLVPPSPSRRDRDEFLILFTQPLHSPTCIGCLSRHRDLRRQLIRPHETASSGLLRWLRDGWS